MLKVQEQPSPLVYYVLRDGLVKIGTTEHFVARMRRLKADKILAVEPGSYELETQRHTQFSAERVDIRRGTRRNEWFRPSENLLAHAEALRLAHGIPEIPVRGWVPEQGSAERWRPVVGYEDRYRVSDLGRVHSLSTLGHPGRLLKLFPSGAYGYLAVKLCRDNTGLTAHVHVLVAAAFIGPRPPGQYTRHGPGGHLDNRLVNLSYGTPTENAQDMVRDGNSLRGVKSPFAKLTDAQVADIRRQVAAGAMQRTVAALYGIQQPAVSMIVNGKAWGHVDGVEEPLTPAATMARRASRTPYPHELIVALYDRWVAGETVPVLAAEAGMKPQTLSARFYALEKLPGHVVDRPNRRIDKLTPELTAELNARYLAGESVVSLAAEIGMEKSSIHMAFRRLALGARPGVEKRKVKLTEADVIEIRRRVAAGESYAAPAKDYGISESNVSMIIARKTWRNC